MPRKSVGVSGFGGGDQGPGAQDLENVLRQLSTNLPGKPQATQNAPRDSRPKKNTKRRNAVRDEKKKKNEGAGFDKLACFNDNYLVFGLKGVKMP